MHDPEATANATRKRSGPRPPAGSGPRPHVESSMPSAKGWSGWPPPPRRVGAGDRRAREHRLPGRGADRGDGRVVATISPPNAGRASAGAAELGLRNVGSSGSRCAGDVSRAPARRALAAGAHADARPRCGLPRRGVLRPGAGLGAGVWGPREANRGQDHPGAFRDRGLLPRLPTRTTGDLPLATAVN